jgi:ATP-binding cassette subfamily B protein
MKTGQNVKISQIFRQFWTGIRPNRAIFFSTIIINAISLIIGILIPLFYKEFFDVLGKAVDKTQIAPVLIKIIIFILIFKVINWLLFRIGIYAFDFLASKVMARLKQNSFNYMLRHSYNFFTNNFTGSLVQRVNRFTRAYETLSEILIYNILSLFITITGSIIITWFIAPFVSITIVVWVILVSIFNVSFSAWKLKYDILVAEADSKTTGYLSDAITNNSAISLFTGNAFEKEGFNAVSNDQANKARFSWYLGDTVDAVQAIFITIAEFFIFYFIIKYWERGIATIGTFVLAQTYIINLAQQLWGSSKLVRRIYESIADSKEMVEILEAPYEIKDAPRAKDLRVNKGEIVFKNVSFSFNETREVLADLNLTIKAGEKVAIIGPSGAGKTTFVRLIMRLYELAKGQIEIDGQNIQGVTQDSLRRNISLVPQDPILFHRTLIENIRYGKRDATDEEVRVAARLAHCDEFIETLPLKYETYVGERGIKLSGGERQRVAIARAILKHAPIMILDEATSSLDSHSEMLIQDALDNLMKNCTTIVIAHRLSTIRKMDRIIAMKNGKIIEEGTHDELSNKDSGLYKDLWELQAGGFIQKED